MLNNSEFKLQVWEYYHVKYAQCIQHEHTVIHATDVKDDGVRVGIHCMLQWPNVKMVHAYIWEVLAD